MDKLIEEGQWWWPFLVPIVTGILALVGSLVGTKLGKTTEHKQWLRNKKQEAYANFFREADAQFIKVNQWVTGRSPEAAVNGDELAVHRAMVKLIGSPNVRRIAKDVEFGLIGAAHKRTVALAAAEEARGHSSDNALKLKTDTFRDYNTLTDRLRDDLIRFVNEARKDLDAGSPEDGKLNEGRTVGQNR